MGWRRAVRLAVTNASPPIVGGGRPVHSQHHGARLLNIIRPWALPESM